MTMVAPPARGGLNNWSTCITIGAIALPIACKIAFDVFRWLSRPQKPPPIIPSRMFVGGDPTLRGQEGDSPNHAIAVREHPTLEGHEATSESSVAPSQENPKTERSAASPFKEEEQGGDLLVQEEVQSQKFGLTFKNLVILQTLTGAKNKIEKALMDSQTARETISPFDIRSVPEVSNSFFNEQLEITGRDSEDLFFVAYAVAIAMFLKCRIRSTVLEEQFKIIKKLSFAGPSESLLGILSCSQSLLQDLASRLKALKEPEAAYILRFDCKTHITQLFKKVGLGMEIFKEEIDWTSTIPSKLDEVPYLASEGSFGELVYTKRGSYIYRFHSGSLAKLQRNSASL